MQQYFAPTFTATPDGILADGMPLNKSASQNLSPEMMHYVKRAEELLATVKKEDWNNRTPHATNDVPTLAKAQMMLALASPQLYLPQQQTRQELIKDAGDDSDDEDDDDDSDSRDDSSDDGDYADSGNGHYNPDEPRIPAGQPGGGQWTTAGNGATSDSGSISADDVRSALIDGFNNPSSLPQGAQVATNDTVQSDANPPAGSATPVTQPATNMTLSNQGVDFLTQHEGFNSNAYQDNAGYNTIGYGHRLTDGESYPDGITQAQGAQLLAQDTATAQAAVRNNVTANLTQAQFDALTSFAYNVGASNFANSTLVQNINNGNNAAAADQFDQWVHSTNQQGQQSVNPGLVNRRTAERNLFENGNY